MSTQPRIVVGMLVIGEANGLDINSCYLGTWTIMVEVAICGVGDYLVDISRPVTALSWNKTMIADIAGARSGEVAVELLPRPSKIMTVSYCCCSSEGRNGGPALSSSSTPGRNDCSFHGLQLLSLHLPGGHVATVAER